MMMSHTNKSILMVHTGRNGGARLWFTRSLMRRGNTTSAAESELWDAGRLRACAARVAGNGIVRGSKAAEQTLTAVAVTVGVLVAVKRIVLL